MTPPPIATSDATNAAIAAAQDAQDSEKLNLTPGQARVVLERTAGTLAAAHGITVEFQEGACPQTDGRKIIIPPPNVTSWEEWLQVRGYIDHETSHVLFTDMNEFQPLNDFERLCLNALEDVRVNELMRHRYPGSIDNLRGMYKRTIQDIVKRRADKSAQPIPEHMSKLGALQIQTENLQSLGAPENLFGDAGVAFGKQHGPRFSADIAAAQTTRDLVKPARDLARLIDPARAAQPPTPGQGDGEGEEGDGDGQGQKPGNANGNPQAGNGKDQGESDQPGASPLDQASKQAMGNVGGGAATYRDAAARSRKERDATNDYQNRCDRGHANDVPKIESFMPQTRGANTRHYQSAGFGPDENAKGITDAMRMGAGLRDNLKQALRARSMARKTRDQETGNLDMGKLAVIAARVRDPAVYCKVAPGIAVNTACHVLVDASGSMSGSATWPTCPAAAAVFADAAIACGAVARVTTFDAPEVGYEFCAYGEKPTRAEWVNRMKYAAPTGGTPTGNHVQVAARDLLKRPEQRKILVVVTDGQPDSDSYYQAMVGAARAAGVEVYVIALGWTQANASQHLGAGAVACKAPDDLRGTLLRVLTRCLVRQEGKGVRA